MGTHRQKKCAAKVWLKCMQRHDNESSDLWRRQSPSLSTHTATCTGLETKQIETQRENNSLPLRANCSNDQDEQQPFDTTTRKRTTGEEKTRMITHRSNKTTGLSCSHHHHGTASVSQHSKDTRAPFYTPERRSRADSAELE